MDEKKETTQTPPIAPGGRGAQAKNFSGTWMKLLQSCKGFRHLIFIAIFAAVAGVACTLVGPNRLSALTELVTAGLTGPIDMAGVARIAVTLVILYALGALLTGVQGWLMATATARLAKKLRSEISHKINRLPMGYYSRTSTGDILSRVTNDLDTISMSMNRSVGNMVHAFALLFGSLLMMLLTNVPMALTAVVATLIGFALMRIIMRRSLKYFVRQQKHLGQLNGHVEEIYTGHTVVRAYNGEANAKQTFDALNGQLRSSMAMAQSLAGMMMPIMTFVGNLGYVAVCVLGAVLAQRGTIGFGVIVAFMIYERYFTQPLSQIAQGFQTMQSAAAAGERVFEFLEAEEMPDEQEKPEHPGDAHGDVEFRHVRFGYDPQRPVIHDFSAKAAAGQKIAIVGPTGAGKTTLVNLLMRFYEPDGGEICIDGVPTGEMKREDVHRQFCMVLQDTWLFEGTMRENLVYCAENVPEEKIVAACEAVGLDHFIRTLPHGYDTVLNDQVSLSAGQKQQLTIARAMIADRPMLILDEATSSVDTRTELQIQNAMDRLMEGRTSFVIAHRLSTIKNADLILVLRGGDVVESGTHEELLAQGGFYAELYNSQFEDAS
ncbi:MAG: ABC transporter ATP-binding protein/permease [Oscillospiraceae bacterium]|nr:ABC transporter ATP-binding protein/permease [Oscillospiraceae bacterium]